MLCPVQSLHHLTVQSCMNTTRKAYHAPRISFLQAGKYGFTRHESRDPSAIHTVTVSRSSFLRSPSLEIKTQTRAASKFSNQL